MEQTEGKGSVPSQSWGDHLHRNPRHEGCTQEPSSGDGTEDSPATYSSDGIPSSGVSVAAASKLVGKGEPIGYCAVLLLSNGSVYCRSRVTSEHQARLTAKQWQNEFVSAGIQAIYGDKPEVIHARVL